MRNSPHHEGDPASKILFLAEAPSRVEMKLGRPLVGPSGEVFNDCLHAAGIARAQCYILNIWPFEVEKNIQNDILRHGDLLYHHNKGFTELGLAEAQPTLDLIRNCGANIVATMGQAAMHLALGSKRPVTKWRGSVVEGCENVQGRKVIPTIHPAATLHGTYLWRYLLIADYEKAKVQAAFREHRPPAYKIDVATSLHEVEAYVKACKKAGRVCTDLEVINHQISCFSLAFWEDHALVVPLHHLGGDPYWSLDDEERIWILYAQLMGDPEVAKINQNIVGFDAVFLLQQNNIFTRGPLYDTMIAQHILYPDFRKGLDFITSIHTDMPYYKDEGKMWRNEGGDIEEFWQYNGKDAIAALVAWEALAQEMTDGSYWPTYNMTVEMADMLSFMTLHGLRIDQGRLASTHEDVSTKLAAKEQELAEVADFEFNPSSSQQCKKYFYEHKGLSPYRSHTGAITTDDKAMSRILRRYSLPEAKLVQEIRALRKLKSTYLEVDFDADSRLRCSWNPRGTSTGRLSSSETVFGTGMNLQNLAPDFKSFIIADEDGYNPKPELTKETEQ